MPRDYAIFVINPLKGDTDVKQEKSQLFLVEVPAAGDDEGVEIVEEESPGLEDQIVGLEMIETKPCISLQAINGIQRFQTMRVTGHYGKKATQVLIDSGSTHNFVDLRLAQRLRCKIEPIHLQPVSVVEDSELKCEYICK